MEVDPTRAVATLANARFRLLALGILAVASLLLASAGGAEARPHLTKVHMRTHLSHGTASRLSLSVVTQTPTDGAIVSGTIPWQVSTSGVRVARVEFAIDGTVKWTDYSAPFAYGGAGLDTSQLANGAHRLTATAYAKRSKPASATIGVTVSNQTPAPAAEAATPTPTPEPEPTQTLEPTPVPAPETSPSPTPTPSSIYWGAWIGKQLTGDQPPWDMTAVTKFEEMAGKKLSIINFSAPFANCSSSPCTFYNFPVNEMNAIRNHGAIPFYSWASQSIPSTTSEPNFQLADVIAGTYDSYIRKFAEAAKAWGHPFFLRFNWEMNGAWFPWSERTNGNHSGEFVTAWRHVHDIFASVGATNATWVWCPNIDPNHQMQSLASLYPGNEYVDWTGLDGYNWGTNPAKPDRWRSFNELYKSTYDEITGTIASSKPLIVSEIGSTEYGGSKATWIREALSAIPTSYPKIRGLLWFEQYDDGMDWPIETSTGATSAFAAGIQSPAYTENTFGSAAATALQPPS